MGGLNIKFHQNLNFKWLFFFTFTILKMPGFTAKCISFAPF